MKTSNIILISVFSLVLSVVVTACAMYVSFNNREVNLRNLAEAQRGNIENVYDKMWKILQQKAQVTDEYKEAFREIYPQLIEGRYSQGDGSLMKWIQESNPSFDTSLYKDLMNSIEVERTYFASEQKKMLDIIRQHNTLRQSIPSGWFVGSRPEIGYTVISSSKAKTVMEHGEDNDIDLFKK